MLLPSWMGNGWGVLLFTFACFVGSHLAAIYIIDARIRGRITYAAVLLSGLTVLSSYVSSVGTINAVNSEILSHPLRQQAQDIDWQIKRSFNYFCEMNGQKTQFSPDDFEKIETQRELACGKVMRINEYANANWVRLEQSFEPPKNDLAVITDEIYKSSFSVLEQTISRYNNTAPH